MSDSDISIETISFMECLVKGGWEKTVINNDVHLLQSFKATNDNSSEIWIVRPDGLKRGWNFKLGAIVFQGTQIIQFNQKDVKQELSPNEEENEQSNLPQKLGDFGTETTSNVFHMLSCAVCGATTVVKELPRGMTLQDVVENKTCGKCGRLGNWKEISQF